MIPKIPYEEKVATEIAKWAVLNFHLWAINHGFEWMESMNCWKQGRNYYTHELVWNRFNNYCNTVTDVARKDKVKQANGSV
jgi:hypothetical protein